MPEAPNTSTTHVHGIHKTLALSEANNKYHKASGSTGCLNAGANTRTTCWHHWRYRAPPGVDVRAAAAYMAPEPRRVAFRKTRQPRSTAPDSAAFSA
jgi:hypothetical protein